MNAAVALSERTSAPALGVSLVRGAVDGGRDISVPFATPPNFASLVDCGRSLSSRELLVRGGSWVIALARSASDLNGLEKPFILNLGGKRGLLLVL
jgi:hypothetical protein